MTGHTKTFRLTRKSVHIEKLLEPGYIGKLKTRNRMTKSAAYGWTLYDTAKDTLRPEGLAFYENIAKGGIGLLFMEIFLTMPRPLLLKNFLIIYPQLKASIS